MVINDTVCHCLKFNESHLKHWSVDEILLQEGLGAHVVHDGGGKVVEDGVHGVAGLLPRHPEILLQRPGNAGEDGLGRLVGVQGAGRALIMGCSVNIDLH